MSFHCQPNGVALLESARETLKTLLKDLPAARRYDALMVVNALGIVMRRADVDLNEDERLHETLTTLLEREGVSDAGDGATKNMRRLEAELTQRIRHGQLNDGDIALALRAYLYARTVARLEVSNPRYLATMIRNTAHE